MQRALRHLHRAQYLLQNSKGLSFGGRESTNSSLSMWNEQLSDISHFKRILNDESADLNVTLDAQRIKALRNMFRTTRETVELFNKSREVKSSVFADHISLLHVVHERLSFILFRWHLLHTDEHSMVIKKTYKHMKLSQAFIDIQSAATYTFTPSPVDEDEEISTLQLQEDILSTLKRMNIDFYNVARCLNALADDILRQGIFPQLLTEGIEKAIINLTRAAAHDLKSAQEQHEHTLKRARSNVNREDRANKRTK